MKWCEVFQCFADEVDDIMPEEAFQYCEGFSCDECDSCSDVKEGRHHA
jgi:hypothetical protein